MNSDRGRLDMPPPTLSVSDKSDAAAWKVDHRVESSPPNFLKKDNTLR